MKKTNGDKPVTIADLGQMLLKYFSPIYKDLGELKSDVKGLHVRVDQVEKIQLQQSEDINGLKDDVDEVKRIQLRMEQNLGKKVESLKELQS